MKKEKYIADLAEIKNIMNRSSRFLSLSGLAGVWAGIIAIGAAWWVYPMLYQGVDFSGISQADLDQATVSKIFTVAVVTLSLAIGGVIFFSSRKAKKENLKMWDHQAKILLINLAIPLATGGVLCLLFLAQGFVGLLAPFTLIFYGLALVNASKYTLQEVRSLGLLEIALGLGAVYFIGFGLWFWVVGFGVLHIAYGLYMYFKYGA